MTTKDFLREFESTHGALHWNYVENGAVRGTFKSVSVSKSFDPLTAVLFSRDPDAAIEDDPARAGVLLGLSDDESRAIRDATEGTIWKWIDGSLVLDGYLEWLRERISLAAGLEPDESASRMPSLTGPSDAEVFAAQPVDSLSL